VLNSLKNVDNLSVAAVVAKVVDARDLESRNTTDQDFKEVVPAEILSEFDDLPLTFTFFDSKGLLVLAHLCTLGPDVSRFLVSKTNDAVVTELKNGMLSIRSALLRPPLWLLDVRSDGSIAKAWNTTAAEIPDDAIPDTNVLLTAELEAEQRADEKLARFAKSDSDGQMSFDGAPVIGHAVEAGFFGRFWDRFQSLYDTTAAVLFGPNIKPYETKILLGDVSKSSYAIEMRMPTPQEDGRFFDSNDEMERRKKVLETVRSMMVDKVQPAETVDIINRHENVRKYYGELLELISHRAASISFRTRRHPAGRVVTHNEVGQKLAAVKNLGFPYGRLNVKGKWIEGKLDPDAKKVETNFEIRVSDSLVYSGKVLDDAIPKIKLIHLGDYVEAILQIETVEGKPQTYKLFDIVVAKSPSPV
jgi:hypothetical protein